MERLPAGKKLKPRMRILKNLLELALQDVIGIVGNYLLRCTEVNGSEKIFM